jgi:hypothetical protein
MAKWQPLLLLIGTVGALAQPPTAPAPAQVFEDPRLTVRVLPRSPQQVAAFYEARGFPPAMRTLIMAQCFLTVRIHNTSQDVIWLDLADWRFVGVEGQILRRDRDWWKAQWRDMNAPLPSQSTFRWTLLPEQLDFRPDEAEGGNVTLIRTAAPFRLEADFVIGAERGGEMIRMKLEGLHCAEDETP